MGLFDNIIGTGAIEEVDPLGMEHITDDNAPTPGTPATGTGGATGTSSGTGGAGSSLFGGFSGKKDDGKGDDGSVLIINDAATVAPQVENNNAPTATLNQSQSPIIDTNSEIPDIDIGGDMNFGALIEDIPATTIVENLTGTPLPQINTAQELPQNTIPVTPVPNQEVVQNVSPVNNISVSPVSEGVVIPINSLFENINTPSATETVTLNAGVVAPVITGVSSIPNNNISLIDTAVSTESTGGIPAVSQSENSPANTSINLLDGLNSETPVVPIATITTELLGGSNSLISDSITEPTSTKEEAFTLTPTIISIDTPPEHISETAVNIATDIQKTKESLAERISEFLKELETLKANDEALLKEKQAAIAKLEEAKKPIEEELKKIQDDEKRINDTIDLLSNIKNI